MIEQKTKEWFVARFGNITSSNVGKLIGKGRAKDALFTATGYSYLNGLIAERNLIEEISTDLEAFNGWRARCEGGGYATQWGEAHESEARIIYGLTVENLGLTVVECGYDKHPEIEGWGDSSDGLVYEGFELVGTLEIKCPYSPANSVMYIKAMQVAEDKAEALKEVNAEYYWQCVSHCVCHSVKWCDFVVYDPMLKQKCWIWKINPSEEDKALLAERVRLAIEYVSETQL